MGSRSLSGTLAVMLAIGLVVVWQVQLQPRFGPGQVIGVRLIAAPGGARLLVQQVVTRSASARYGGGQVVSGYRLALVDPATGKVLETVVGNDAREYLGQSEGPLWFRDDGGLHARDPRTLKELIDQRGLLALRRELAGRILAARFDAPSQRLQVQVATSTWYSVSGPTFELEALGREQAVDPTPEPLPPPAPLRLDPRWIDARPLTELETSGRLEFEDPQGALIVSKAGAGLQLSRVDSDGQALWTVPLADQPRLVAAHLASGLLDVISSGERDWLTVLDAKTGQVRNRVQF